MAYYKYSLLDEGTKVKRRLIQLVFFIITIGILLAIVIPTYIAYSTTQSFDSNFDKAGTNITNTPLYTIGNQPGNFTNINDGAVYTSAVATILFTLSGIDAIAGTAKVRLQLINNVLDSRPSYIFDYYPNYSFYFNGEQKNITSNMLMTEWTYIININGDNAAYPFDFYQGDIAFQFFPGDTFTNGITIDTYATGAQTGWNISIEANYHNGVYIFSPTIRRSYATKGFSLFVVTLSWILTLCQLFISCQAVLRNRPTISLLSVPAALLFALPNLRNTQPGVPPVGIFLDIAGFYWNMAIVSLSLITSSILYIFQFDVDGK